MTVSVHVDMNFAPVMVRIESGRDQEEARRLVAGRDVAIHHLPLLSLHAMFFSFKI